MQRIRSLLISTPERTFKPLGDFTTHLVMLSRDVDDVDIPTGDDIAPDMLAFMIYYLLYLYVTHAYIYIHKN